MEHPLARVVQRTTKDAKHSTQYLVHGKCSVNGSSSFYSLQWISPGNVQSQEHWKAFNPTCLEVAHHRTRPFFLAASIYNHRTSRNSQVKNLRAQIEGPVLSARPPGMVALDSRASSDDNQELPRVQQHLPPRNSCLPSPRFASGSHTEPT